MIEISAGVGVGAEWTEEGFFSDMFDHRTINTTSLIEYLIVTPNSTCWKVES